MPRGELRVYLGAAPGVGKTFAMLDEGWRRKERGADVVVAVVETHGRAKTAAQLRDLEVVPRRMVEYRGASISEMDVDAVLARRPAIALVDELAHTNAPGSANEKRWQDVQLLLDAGIHVITTLNVQHLESLNDVVEKITGVGQRETVPDAVVRQADQIELVDMSPEALRRRMAHGNVYPAERVDAALRNYFRAGNLAALRELALLWVADRVEDGLDDYRTRHGITATWETRERVVVGLTGAPGGDALIRRAARIAARARGELVGVHVTSADGLRTAGIEDRGDLQRHRDLLVELGGRYHEVSGDDIADTLGEFARSQAATQLVLGASRRTGWRAGRASSIVARTIASAAGIDVHVIAAPDAEPTGAPLHRRLPLGSLPVERVLSGWAIVLIGLPLLTIVLNAERGTLSLATDLLVYLGVIVAAAAVGGIVPGIVGAVAGSLLANWFLVPPVHTFTIGQAENALALAVFVAIAATVSGYVNLAARRALDARRAQADAEALARTTATLIGATDPLPELVEQLRATYRLEGLSVLRRDEGRWNAVATSGDAPLLPDEGRALPLDPSGANLLVLRGRALTAQEEGSLHSHAGQLSLGLAAREREQEAVRLAALEEIDALRTAMLRSVSHDLRTPLAGIKTAVTSLLSPEVTWNAATTKEFLETVDVETDRLTRLVDNLLDMSRLQAGALSLRAQPLAIEDVIAAALGSLSSRTDQIRVDVPDGLPLVAVDGVLLERALANVIANAVAWSPVATPILVQAEAVSGNVVVSVVDRGPGIPERERDRVLRPFQRFSDGAGSPHGAGLGLAVADGFVTAMHGRLVLDDTPGGGLTVGFVLPLACSDVPPNPEPDPSQNTNPNPHTHTHTHPNMNPTPEVIE